MDAVEPLLRPIVGLINRRIRATTPALDLCQELAGRTVALRVSNTALNAYAVVDPDGIRLLGEYDDDPDVIISGSLLSLARLGSDDAMAAVRDKQIEISGDAETAAAFRKLLELGKPDIEDELSRLVGDSAAHRVGELVKGAVGRGREFAQAIGDSVAGRVAQRQDTPSGDEAERFGAGVREVRDATERLEARMRSVAERISGNDG